MTTCADVLDRRLGIYQQLHEALRLNSGKIFIRDVFPNFNDRKLARRIADREPGLQYDSRGPSHPATVSVISTNGEQPQPE